MNAEHSLIARIEDKRSSIREYSDRIVALLKQGHIDIEGQQTLEMDMVRALNMLMEAHTNAYRNANNNLLKKWDLNA